MTTPALTLRGVTKRFGDTVAVAGVDLDLADGEILALVGPSGCGKSTLLRTVAGLIDIDDGVVQLGDTVVDDGRARVAPEHRRVGLVFQEHALFPHLSVGDNVAFGVRDLPRADKLARRDEWLDLVGLADYAQRFPHELSGGERQRVALARALAPHPRLMLLDEPFASLDPNLRRQIRGDVVGLLRATGTPAVFVTHDQDEALAVGDRVAVMRAGRIEQIDDPVTVFHRPANRFVAGFMGEASFLPVRQGQTELGPVDEPAGLAMARPDDVTFAVAPDGGSAVVAAEFRGATWAYTLRLPSGQLIGSTSSHLDHVPPGTAVDVALVPGHRLVPVADQD